MTCVPKSRSTHRLNIQKIREKTKDNSVLTDDSCMFVIDKEEGVAIVTAAVVNGDGRANGTCTTTAKRTKTVAEAETGVALINI